MNKELEYINASSIIISNEKVDNTKSKSDFYNLSNKLELLEKRVTDAKSKVDDNELLGKGSKFLEKLLKIVGKVFLDKNPYLGSVPEVLDPLLNRDQLKNEVVLHHTIFERDTAEKELRNEIDHLIEISPKADYTVTKEPKDVVIS